MPTLCTYFMFFALSALVFFVALNLLALCTLRIKERLRRRDSGGEGPLEEAYPDLEEQAIADLRYETWNRRLQYEPYTQLRERPYRGRYVNVDENGFRHVQGQGPWPIDPKNFNVFLFGGSTSFGYGVPDSDTIASRLQETLSSKREYDICLYNFARGFYYSTQECILLERLLASGAVPNMAIFIDGLNEFSQHEDEPYYADRIRDFVDRRLYVSSMIEVMNRFPLIRVLRSALKARPASKDDAAGAEAPWHEDGVGSYWYDNEPLVSAASERFLRNKKIIESVALSHGVRTVFVWEPIPAYKYDLRWHAFIGDGFGRHRCSRHGYIYIKNLFESVDIGDNFLWCASMQEAVREPLYVDNVHYSPKMSRLLSRMIAEFVLEKKLLPQVWRTNPSILR